MRQRLDMEGYADILLLLIEQNGDVAVPVTGNSMVPLWRHKRDQVVLTRCDGQSLRKGDIPLYRSSNGQLVLHRIIRVHKSGYDMCGDAQTRLERNLPKDSICAVVTVFTHKGKVYSIDHPAFRLYSFLWMWLRPIRRVVERGRTAWRRWRR